MTQGRLLPSWREDPLPALRTDPLVPWVDVSPAQPPRLWQVGGRPGAAAECPGALRHSQRTLQTAVAKAGAMDEAATYLPAQVPCGLGGKHISTLLS